MRRDMTLSEYIAWWRARRDAGCGQDAAEAAGDRACAGGVGGSGNDDVAVAAEPLLYLKDWHFASEHLDYTASLPSAGNIVCTFPRAAARPLAGTMCDWAG